jgi:alpha-ketoglutarate-dependent taurine dioxygenase
MKITKIPGLGRFGVFIDDLDFSQLTDDEWMEIGKLHLESLVTIIRNVKIDPRSYELLMAKWGNARYLSDFTLKMKYADKGAKQIDQEDQDLIKAAALITATEVHPESRIIRVSGKRDKDGNPLGMFAEGELLWHSNESGNLVFAPGVSLLGSEGVVGSCTGFLTTTDWYEDQTESFRSELDEMTIRHEFTPGRISPGIPREQDIIVYRNMCPVPTEMPLVCSSPGGIKGLHYSVNTISSIKGMSHDDSQKLFKEIDKTLFVDKYMYDHWYQQDNDLCLFDNSITLHRRLGGITNRMCFRIQHDYRKIMKHLDLKDDRYFLEPFKSQYVDDLAKINSVLEIE